MATIRGIKGTAFHWGRRPGEEGSMRCAVFRELETREGEIPSPSAPPPMAIATTVHCMKTYPRKKSIPGTSRVQHPPHHGGDEDPDRVQQSGKAGTCRMKTIYRRHGGARCGNGYRPHAAHSFLRAPRSAFASSTVTTRMAPPWMPPPASSIPSSIQPSISR